MIGKNSYSEDTHVQQTTVCGAAQPIGSESFYKCTPREYVYYIHYRVVRTRCELQSNKYTMDTDAAITCGLLEVTKSD